jgi:two-component system sensor histidine kinase KdpD
MPSNRDPHPRPSPDALLAAAVREERGKGGRLKVFLGAAPGVGKTYTMLEAARVRAMAGGDVAIGVVESHGRIETAELMLGLDIIPRVRIEYRGQMLQEMDLDAILARRPQLVIVDELAHTNVAGSRHPKRYLDVEEILDAGIDVYTTVNIQHIESLNDAVAQITGVRVRETVPDKIMERADEVELVDLSVEDLLARLRDGKVYVPEQAERAIGSYFRPGNLNALRQLALRHVAERVEDAMHTYMQAHAIPGPWPTTERLMVSVGPSPLSSRLVRATRRMAERRRAEWIAVYVETPQHFRLAEDDRARLAGTLRLAEELGGEAMTIQGDHVADDLLRYARRRNVTEIVVGKSLRTRWFEMRHGSIVNDLIRKSDEIDVYVITGDEQEGRAMAPVRAVADEKAPASAKAYLWGLAAVGGAALVAYLLKSWISLPNLLLIFLLAVLLSAVQWGLRASIVASVASVLAYDFFFIDPVHTFTIASPQDVLALSIFLVVAFLTSNLTGRIRDAAQASRHREALTAALYGLSRAIAGATSLESVLRAIVQQVAGNLGARVVALLPEEGHLVAKGSHPEGAELTENERGAATWAWRNNRPAGRGADTLPGERWFYLPLCAAQQTVGVLALAFEERDTAVPPERMRLLESLADQASVAIERARLVRDMDQAKLLAERERLQAILLSSISHDLRTPLASILGSATTLLERGTVVDEPTRRDLLITIQEEAERLNRFVGNLLDTTRLESGALKLNREWVEIGDVLGSALTRLAGPLGGRPVHVDIAPGLPLLKLDFVLIEQVFINLLDNAAKYSSAGASVRVAARLAGDRVDIMVEDEGVGIPEADLERVFDKFYRVRHGDRQMAGTGLGLSICRGIVEEHGGSIRAVSPAAAGRGTRFVVTLPVEADSPRVEQQEIQP